MNTAFIINPHIMFWNNGNKGKKLWTVCVYSFLGMLVGVVLGFVFGLLIAEISGLFAEDSFESVPRAMSVFLGMGFGSVIGGVFGGVVGYKE